MGLIKIAVCDDNALCLRELKEQLLSQPDVEKVFTFSDLDSFLSSVNSGKRYDAVFMDIDLGQGDTGIDAAEKLYTLRPDIKIIYVTGHSEYSQHILLRRANLCGFLTKPVDSQLLKANLMKLTKDISLTEQPSIILRQGGVAITVPYQRIFYIESKGRMMETHTVEEVIVSPGQLSEIMQSLPSWFVQCHKSYLVNLRQIQRFGTNDIVLKNGSAVPVSRAKYKQTKEAYFDFIGDTF